MREVPDALRSVKRFIADTLAEFEVALIAEEGTFTRPFARVGLASPTQFPEGSAHTAEHIQPMACHIYPTVDPTLSAEEHLLRAYAIEARLARAIRYDGGGRIAVPEVFALGAVPDAGTLPAASYTYKITAQGRRGSTASLAQVVIALAAPGGVALSWPALMGARRYQLWRGGLLIANVKPSGTATESYLDKGAVTPNPTAVIPTADTARVGAPLRIPLYQYDNVALNQAATVRGLSDFLRVRDLSIGRQIEDEDERRITITVDLRVSWARGAERPDDSRILRGLSSKPGSLA